MGALGAILAAIVVPVVLDRSQDTALAQDAREVKEAVRLYHIDIGGYPTFGATPAPNQTPTVLWVAGGIPGPDSIPQFGGIDFDASASRLADSALVRFHPDYLPEKPSHSGQAAADGTQRWRIDGNANVSIEMDGRSY